MKKFTIILAATVLALSSCDSFLDMTPTDRVSPKVIWATTQNAEYNINYIYTYLWDMYSSPTGLGLTEALTDELKYTSYNNNALCFIPSEMAYGGNLLGVTYVDTYMGKWSGLYTRIRKTNEALFNLHRYGAMSDADKRRLEGELQFMRGFLYFELTKRYKDVIIYGEDLNTINKDAPLQSEEEAWDFVLSDLKDAAEKLPVKASAKGRLCKDAAYAYITRAMLYARRYDEVIAAANALEELGYDLESDYAASYTKTSGNKEAILQYHFSRANGVSHQFNFYYTPGGDYAILGQSGGGYAVPTQEFVESYELAAGGYPDWSKWHGTTSENPPYDRLEPRFKATVLYNGAAWKGRKIEPYVGGLDGYATWRTDKDPKGKTVTGYYMRKLVDEKYNVTTSGSEQSFTLMRYAEVLLNKAEACALAETADEAAANDALRKVRERVGLGHTNVYGTDLMNAIKRERKIELAFEGLRYWDLRRWGDAHKDYPEGLSNYQQHGLKITKNGENDFTYEYVSVDDKDRLFEQKMYRFPLPVSELENNSSLNQQQPDPNWN